MKFSLVIVTALVSAVTALPSSPPNVEADVDVKPTIPPFKGAGTGTSVGGMEVATHSPSDSWEWGKRDGSEWSKRDADAELAKRALMTVIVYQHQDFGGRSEGLLSETGRCYNLGGNPTWNDQISSFKVEARFGCCFYNDINCGNIGYCANGAWVPWLDSRFNDKFSSYYCYTL